MGAGVKQKKEEDGRVFCQPCWVELYAKTCFVCKQKIEGSAVRKGPAGSASGTARLVTG